MRDNESINSHRYCWCGRGLRPGELCVETYDGHKPRSEAAMAVEADARFFESVPDR